MEVKRATFEHVQGSQDTFFFDFLDKFIKAEETIDPDSRNEYFLVLGNSFLGVEKNYRYILKYNDDFYDLGSLSNYARKLAYITDSDLDSEKRVKIRTKGKNIDVPLVELWKSLRICFFDPAAEALNLSLRISAEMITREGGVYEFKVDQKLPEK